MIFSENRFPLFGIMLWSTLIGRSVTIRNEKPPAEAAGGFHAQPRSAVYGQKLRCTRNMPLTTFQSEGE